MRGRVGIGSMLLVSSALACSSPSPTARPAGCEKVEQRLFSASVAADAQGRVRAVVELVDAGSPAPAGIYVEARADRRLQGLVPVAQLCTVAADPAIRRISAPADVTATK
jgi:hypothetical protein